MSSAGTSGGLKRLIRIDVISDTICPWCFVGKKRLDKAMEETKDLCNFEVRWHPYMLDPSLPKEGRDKNEFHRRKFGSRLQAVVDNIDQAFQSVGYRFGSGGLIGNSLDSHRLIELAGRQGLDKQNAVVENLMIKCLTQQKCVSDREVLLSVAESAGIEGAKEWIDNPNAGLKEVQAKMEKYAHTISGVPHFKINDKYEMSGAQAPQTFIEIFKQASQDEE
uniref:DSBA-like thioredoxin domain-containing protein n=1 Tax=Araucaria cunninghamii TaxID=56994 RepID=A0A0D6R781_ARACU